MAVAFRIAGALAANATTANLGVVSPSTGVIIGDMFIASIYGNGNQVVTPPAGWTLIAEFNNGANMRTSVYWKPVVSAGDIGNTFSFTKPVDDNLLFAGVIYCFSGADTAAIDAGTPSTSPNVSSDTVTYATFDPSETTAFVVAVGQYGDNATTAGAMSGTDPTFTLNSDLETAIGADASAFCYSGASSGAATGSRTHSTTSTADAVNSGVMFGLKASEPYSPAIIQTYIPQPNPISMRGY